jgi:hypothetical protein
LNLSGTDTTLDALAFQRGKGGRPSSPMAAIPALPRA